MVVAQCVGQLCGGLGSDVSTCEGANCGGGGEGGRKEGGVGGIVGWVGGGTTVLYY